MAKKWNEVTASEGFQALSPEQKAAAQEQYFSQVVTPQLQSNQVEAARGQFFSQYPSPVQKSEPEPVSTPTPTPTPTPEPGVTPDAKPEPTTVPSEALQPPSEAPKPEPGFLDRIKELVTGDERSTSEIDRLEEIGSAPELNELSGAAFKASLGLMTQFDIDGMRGVIAQQYPEAEFEEDEKGNPIVVFPSGRYALDKPGLSAQDIAKVLFGVGTGAAAPLAVGARTGAAGVALAGAGEAGVNLATQAAGEALGGQGIDTQEVVLSAALGSGGKGLEDLVSNLSRLKAGDLTDAQKEILKIGGEQNVPIATTDVLPPETYVGKSAQQIVEKIPITGTGVFRAKQEAARGEAVKTFVQKFSEPNYDDIIQSLKGKKELKKRQAGRVLEKVGDALDGTGEIVYGETANAIQEAEKALTKPGVLRSEDAIALVEELKTTITGAPQTFSTLKENRTKLLEKVRAAGKGERSQLPTSEKRVLEKVAAGMSKDMDRTAKDNLQPGDYTKWKEANKAYGEEAEILRTTKIKNVLDKGDLTPEVVDQMLFSKKPSEIRLLYDQLGDKGRANARAAIIQRVLGDRDIEEISPTVFNNRLKKLSPSTKVFFTGDEGKAIKGLTTILDTTRRAADAAVSTATGQQAVPVVLGGVAAQNIGAAILGSSVGAFGKAYESPKVRNALLRLANTPKNSTKFERNFNKANDAIQRALQVANRDEESTRQATGDDF